MTEIFCLVRVTIPQAQPLCPDGRVCQWEVYGLRIFVGELVLVCIACAVYLELSLILIEELKLLQWSFAVSSKTSSSMVVVAIVLVLTYVIW